MKFHNPGPSRTGAKYSSEVTATGLPFSVYVALHDSAALGTGAKVVEHAESDDTPTTTQTWSVYADATGPTLTATQEHGGDWGDGGAGWRGAAGRSYVRVDAASVTTQARRVTAVAGARARIVAPAGLGKP